MAELKQARFQPEHSHHKLSYLITNLLAVAFALVFSGTIFADLGNASAQQEDSSLKRKAELDIQRLELEITKLKKEALSLPGWLTGALAGLLVGVVGTPNVDFTGRRRRSGSRRR